MAKEDSSQTETSTPDDKPAARSMQERIFALLTWAKMSTWRMALVGMIGITLLGSVFAVWSYLAHLAVSVEEPVTLQMALDKLNEGDFEQAESLVREMQRRPQDPDDFGGALYILGSVKAHQAESEWSAARQRAVHLVAARYLQKAQSLGVPREIEPQLLFLLGQSLIQGNQPQNGIRILNQALSLENAPSQKVHILLTDANLALPNPDYDSVLHHNAELLKNPNLTDDQRTEALIVRAETLGQVGRADEAREILKQLSKDRSDDGELKNLSGRLLLSAAEKLPESNPERQAMIEQAVSDLQAAQQLDPFNGALTRQARYWIGKTFELQRDYEEAINEYDQIGKLYGDTPESLASQIAEADLLRFAGKKKQSLAAYRRVLESVGNPTTYSNKLLSLEQLKKHLRSAHASFVEAEEFDSALTLLEQFDSLFEHEVIIELRASTHEAWGQSELKQAAESPPIRAAKLAHDGRYHLRAAGRAYESLAKVRFATREYTDDLWYAAENYYLGQTYTHAARMLEDYLHYEPERRNAAVFLRLGQSYLTLGEIEKAIRALEQCIAMHPRDLAVYQARLECVRAYRQMDRYEEAERLLLENINGDELTPKSPEWRDSLFELGEIQHETGRFEQAFKTLEEAVIRYPDASQALMARYTIARSFHNAAQVPAKNVRLAKTENERQKNRKLRDQNLEGALENYKLVQRMLTLQDHGESNELKQHLLRNCYMMQGSVLFQLRRYEQARKAYANVSTLFQNQPFVLESFVHIANCWRRLDEPLNARRTIEQAKLVLQRLPNDTNFKLATNFNRQQWQLLLNEMSKW